jgi:hypothetical protein
MIWIGPLPVLGSLAVTDQRGQEAWPGGLGRSDDEISDTEWVAAEELLLALRDATPKPRRGQVRSAGEARSNEFHKARLRAGAGSQSRTDRGRYAGFSCLGPQTEVGRRNLHLEPIATPRTDGASNLATRVAHERQEIDELICAPPSNG